MINGVPVVTAPTEIDVTTADQLRTVLLHSAARGHATIVVDMTRTRFCDSAGLTVLVRAHKRALADGGELRLIIPVSRARAVAGQLDGRAPGRARGPGQASAPAAAPANQLRHMTPDPDVDVTGMRACTAAGFDEVHIGRGGAAGLRFFEFYAEQVLPRLREG